jgi:GTPase SAR1 family protein
MSLGDEVERGAGGGRYAVRYDAAVVSKEILTILEDVLRAAQQPRWREATGEAWLARLTRDVGGVRERLALPFCLLVVGDFKRGKSTLINALVGRELVTMDIAPETVAITELHHGPELRVEVRLADGGRVELKPEDLPGQRLSSILANLPGTVDVVRIEAPAPLLEQVTVVDSPGTGDLMWRFDRRVQDYLPRADAVLHVVSALSPLSHTERDFLRLSLRPLDLAKVVFVVNRVDQVRDPADVPRLVTRISQSLRAEFPDSPVVAVSALHTLCRATGDELPRPDLAPRLDRAFAALRETLDERVLVHRDVVRTERGAREAEAVLARAAAELTRLKRALEQDRGAVRDALANARDAGSGARRGIVAREERLRAAVTEMGEQAVAWMDGLVSRLEHETLPQLARATHEDIQRHFPFFLAEALRDGLAACVGAHQERILALVEEISEEAAVGLGGLSLPNGAADMGAAAGKAGFHTPAWTVFDHLHTVAFLLNGLTMGMSSLFTLFTGALDRTQAQEARAEDFRRRVAGAMPELRERTAKSVRGAYAGLANEISSRLRAAQQEELARVEAELSQALEVHDRGVGRIGEANATLDQVLTGLGEGAAALSALRALLQESAR